MPITGNGWEMLITRNKEQKSPTTGRRRMVGKYQVFHDGKAQSGKHMSGTTAESKGPGANKPVGNGLRVELGAYPLATQAGVNYVTIGYSKGTTPASKPKPGILLQKTGKRVAILIHPGNGFLASIGCINLCTSLPNGSEPIDYAPSRERVIAVIDDMKAFIGGKFPKSNGKGIPGASVVIEGEP